MNTPRKYNLPRMKLQMVREGVAPFDAPPVASSSEQAAKIASAFIGESPNEQMIALCMDARNRVRTVITIAVGGSHSCSITAADVLRAVLATGMSSFILSHNHPGGDPTASHEDLAFTSKISSAAKTVGLCMLDHVIVTGEDGEGHHSMFEEGEMS